MRKFILIAAILLCPLLIFAWDRITISGTVRDFDGNVIPGAEVSIRDSRFKTLYSAISDTLGRYFLKVPKGEYPYLTCLRMENHPNRGSFNGSEKDARLEFWVWGIVADSDKALDIRCGRLEVYGVNVFEVQGGAPNYQIYVRPMGLTRFFKAKTDDSEPGLAPPEDRLKAEVFVNGESLSIVNKQRIVELQTDNGPVYGFILTVQKEQSETVKKYKAFRIVLEDLDNGDKGEAVYTMMN